MSSGRPESWLESIVAFVCFAWLLCVLYAAIYTFGPDLDLLVGAR